MTFESGVSCMLVGADKSLLQHFLRIRKESELLVDGLETEDFGLQACTETSPLKWHLAHTTWFFETFILAKLAAQGIAYNSFNPQFEYLFNSYYNAVGTQYPRHQRALLSRPSLTEVMAYRRHVELAVEQHWESLAESEELTAIMTTGLHHERQHQELMLTDLKYNWWHNPLGPAMPQAALNRFSDPGALEYIPIEAGNFQQGHGESRQFAFDNETPAHPVHIRRFQAAQRLVTNREFLSFVTDGGYEDPHLWLADGWAQKLKEGWKQPLYWRQTATDGWQEYTLAGWQNLDPHAPVLHLSFYEAEAYARWSSARLASESELEYLLRQYPVEDSDDQAFWHPGITLPPSRQHLAMDRAARSSNCTVSVGNGAKAPMRPTRDSNRWRGT